MMFRTTTTILAAAMLLLSAFQSFAAEPAAPGQSATTKQMPEKAHAAAKKTKATAAGKKTKVKLVDINSAGKAELKTLPGITDAVADKIIAGRPYGSKADLVGRNIVPAPSYRGISHLVKVTLPYKDVDKNAAYLKKKK